MNQEIKDRLERALEALREAEHQIYSAANAADPELGEQGPSTPLSAQLVGLAAQVETLIDSVESMQE